MKNLFRIICVVMVAFIVLGCNSNQESAIPSRNNTNVVNLDEATIEYFSQGEGEVVILLSGRGLDVSYLKPLALRLEKAGYQVIRINRRGAGKSTGSLNNVSYHTHANDIAGVLQALNIYSANVAGHALGGRIARTFAGDFPELTNSVILMPAAGKIGGDPNEAKATSKLFKPNATDSEVSEGMKYMVGDPSNSERVWKAIGQSSLANRPATLASEATIKTSIVDWWAPAGTMPYLVIQGLKDKSAPPENAQLFKQDMGKRAEIIELPEAGHLAPVEFPDEVSALIVSFLKKHLTSTH